VQHISLIDAEWLAAKSAANVTADAARAEPSVPTRTRPHDPALIDAAAELRAAIAATTANRTGWAPPDQIAERVDPPAAMRALHLSMAAGLDLAYITRDIAADHPGLVAPARVIALRAQGEAEIAAEQGDTRYEGLTWATPTQIAANQVIPLPEPARRGLVDTAEDAIIAVTHAVAVAAELNPRDRHPSDRSYVVSGRPQSHKRDTEPRTISEVAPSMSPPTTTKPVPDQG
jgi:hypothetical protein